MEMDIVFGLDKITIEDVPPTPIMSYTPEYFSLYQCKKCYRLYQCYNN